MITPPVPLRQLVLKVHSRCDLACKHCYVYEGADQSWTDRPKVISEETISWTALRLAEHAKSHALASVQVILHGGEPLLVGPTRLRHICEQLRTALHGVSHLDLRIHTNGVQLSERYLDLFVEFDVGVGISLDGNRSANDRYRVYADGRSSYDKVQRAIALLNEDRYRHLFRGILCTIDVRNDPLHVYDALAATGAPHVDFLLPHATWDTPPLRPEGVATPYADWLLAIHDRWSVQGRPMPVRLFDSVFSTLGGGPSLTESMGLESADVVVVETDGSYEQADSLKIVYDGAPATGKTVFRHTLDEVADHPGMAARQHGLADLCRQCRTCPVVRSCGGGLFAHRYRGDGTGFDNPSVYCADLQELIRSLDDRTGVGAHRPIEGFDALADGTDDGTAARVLLEARQSATRRMITMIGQERAPGEGDAWDAAWRLALDLGEQDTALLESLLSHPYARTWAVRCLGGSAPAGHLASLVAAVALPVKAVDRVAVPVRDGWAHLPMLGRLRTHTAADDVMVTNRQVSAGAAGWEPLRRVRADGLDIALDDLDPYRDCFGAPAAERLTDEDVERWQCVLPQSWVHIRKFLPSVATAIEAHVRIITPLTRAPRPEPAFPEGGFTALGIHLEPDPVRVAVNVVREFRLGLLDALLDVCELYDEADVRTGELLADTYARIATDVLSSDRDAVRRTGAQWVRLSAASSLSPLGRRFVDGMGRTL
ncbi:FxsB family cyclophane-forming radical SAM/SPASM peptide maturase [Streptomyces aquilus]|uniref:FxsB family cyclophane-forming radical SAM/SPASM peptide maturase n=1 Tax=Streptomyces aquilus TaxID=2548456 RepID=UPI00367858B3